MLPGNTFIVEKYNTRKNAFYNCSSHASTQINNLMEINFFANNGATYKIENSKIGVAAIELITSSY